MSHWGLRDQVSRRGSRFSPDIVEDEGQLMRRGSLILQALTAAADVFEAMWRSSGSAGAIQLYGAAGYEAPMARWCFASCPLRGQECLDIGDPWPQERGEEAVGSGVRAGRTAAVTLSAFRYIWPAFRHLDDPSDFFPIPTKYPRPFLTLSSTRQHSLQWPLSIWTPSIAISLSLLQSGLFRGVLQP